MNYESYYSNGDSNGYCLIFPNRKSLSKNRIREIFSEFGNVTNVTAAGDEKGYRFVRYATLEEAKLAIDKLQNHPEVGLIPHRPKNRNQTNGNSNGNTGSTQQRHSTGSTDNFFPRKNKRNSEEVNFVKTEDKVDDLRSQFDNLSTSGHSQKSSGSQKVTSPNVHNRSFNGDSRILRNEYNPQTPDSKTNLLMQLRGTNANSFAPKSPTNSIMGSNGFRNHQNDLRSPQASSGNYDDEIPKLVSFPENGSRNGHKKLILNAEEVVVANIPGKFGSAYILHILEQFEPIAITEIMEVPKKRIRYCHVYFKSAQDAVAVETQFDQISIDGTQLVVLRPCRLMEEAME